MWQRQILLIVALAGAVVVQSTVAAVAQQPAAPVDPVVASLQQRVSKFFEQVSSGSISTAYQELLGPGQLGARESDRKLLEEKTAQIETNYGVYRGFDSVYTKRVGNDLVFVKYLYKCSRFPVLWHVTFYRAPVGGELTADSSRTWQVVSIRFDSDLEVLTLLKE